MFNGIRECYPYLFSNKSANALSEQGKDAERLVVNAIACSKACELACELVFNHESNSHQQHCRIIPWNYPAVDINATNLEMNPSNSEDAISDQLLYPVCNSFDSSLNVDRHTFKLDQQDDPS